MVLADTNILSTFALIDKLILLLDLFKEEQLSISPNVFNEITEAQTAGYAHADKILELIKTGKITCLTPTKNELLFSMDLPMNFGAGERDSLAMARERNLVLLTNERKVINYCQKEGIECIWLEKLLRFLWRDNLLSKGQVEELIKEIELKDKVVITSRDEIFKD